MPKIKPIKVPDSTRVAIMLFPPYGLAWLWTNKEIDKERKVFGSVGMSMYLGLWLVMVGFVLYFFTPLGVGDQIWVAETGYYDQAKEREVWKNKGKVKMQQKQEAPAKKSSPDARLDRIPDHIYTASPGRDAWILSDGRSAQV